MTVSAISFGTSGGATEGTARSPKDEFLKLLVAQLEHQDPMAPQDSAQFVAQLAQFAQVEQSAEANQRLEALEAAQAAGVRAGFANIVGRQITARTNSVVVEAGQAPGGDYTVHVPHQADSGKIVVKNDSGNEVATIDLGSRVKGEVPFRWDGLNKDGAPVPAGKYTFEFVGEDAEGKVEGDIRIRGVAESLDFEGGVIKFLVGGNEVAPADILAIEG
jgi:flagellar basal-body rod modification protein FlgD